MFEAGSGVDGTVLRVSVFVALAVLAPAAGYSFDISECPLYDPERSAVITPMAGAFGVSGVSDSLDTPPIGAIGTEGAAAGRAAGMDGSGVFHADTVCSIRADRAEFPGRFSDTRKFSSACFSACPSFDVSCSPMSFRAAEFRQLTALSCMFHDHSAQTL